LSSATPTDLDTSADGQNPPRGSEYAQLSRLIRQAGLLRRRPGYYSWKIAATALLLAAGWAGFILVGDSWWTVAVAVFLAVDLGVLVALLVVLLRPAAVQAVVVAVVLDRDHHDLPRHDLEAGADERSPIRCRAIPHAAAIDPPDVAIAIDVVARCLVVVHARAWNDHDVRLIVEVNGGMAARDGRVHGGLRGMASRQDVRPQDA